MIANTYLVIAGSATADTTPDVMSYSSSEEFVINAVILEKVQIKLVSSRGYLRLFLAKYKKRDGHQSVRESAFARRPRDGL